jgi:hypothetical protein
LSSRHATRRCGASPTCSEFAPPRAAHSVRLPGHRLRRGLLHRRLGLPGFVVGADMRRAPRAYRRPGGPPRRHVAGDCRPLPAEGRVVRSQNPSDEGRPGPRALLAQLMRRQIDDVRFDALVRSSSGGLTRVRCSAGWRGSGDPLDPIALCPHRQRNGQPARHCWGDHPVGLPRIRGIAILWVRSVVQ